MVSGSCPWDPPADLFDCLVQDLQGEGAILGLHGRRVVLVPQDSDGTPRSMQDASAESFERDFNQSNIGHSEDMGPSRRLVLVGGGASQHQPSPVSIADGNTDTMSDALGSNHDFGVEASTHESEQGDGEDWQSEIGQEEFIDSEPEDELPFRMLGAATARTAFRSIQSVNLVEIFQERASVMKSVPRFLRGP